MEKLLSYHISSTEKRLDKLHDDIRLLSEKIDTLNDFKTKSMVTARHISLLVSAISGLATMICTALISYYLQKEH